MPKLSPQPFPTPTFVFLVDSTRGPFKHSNQVTVTLRVQVTIDFPKTYNRTGQWVVVDPL